MRKEGAMSARTFEVTVEREGTWWVFEIPELGTGGQARNLAEVDYEAQGVAAMWLNVSPETVAVNVTVKGPEHALSEWAAAERDEQEARIAQARAADVGRVLGISKQRVYQIEKTTEAGKTIAGQKVAGQKVAGQKVAS